ncbi:hypothetical protein ACIBAG_14880 [Streptomyces sp. NPDC051243]|uniref:hypothetical protein n=1 Tax=Streptomyces sp. NPDC051243 TaxID=3365646 RepID=UPI0037A77F84
MGQSLVLRDALGGRVQLEPRILIANPSLWLRLDTDAQLAQTSGSLHEGRAALDHLSARVDRETALAIFKVSGMEDWTGARFSESFAPFVRISRNPDGFLTPDRRTGHPSPHPLPAYPRARAT